MPSHAASCLETQAGAEDERVFFAAEIIYFPLKTIQNSS